MADDADLDEFEDEVEDIDESLGNSESGSETEGSSTREFEEMEVESDRVDGLGVISATEGISIGDENRITAYITAENRKEVRVGRYFTVPYPSVRPGENEKLFVRVAGLRYVQQFSADDANEIHAQRAMKQTGVDEADYKFLAELEPVAVVSGNKRRMPDRIPKPNSRVERASDKSEIKTGLSIPDDGVFLGHLAVGGEKVRAGSEPPTIDYCLRDDYSDANPLIFRHLLIAGGTGSGKSHTAKNVLRQFVESEYKIEEESGTVDREPAVVVFDPQNEYSQMHDDNPEVSKEDERSWETQGVAYGGYDETTTFVPKVDGFDYDANHRAPQIEFSVPFEMVRENVWLLAGGALNENQLRGLKTLVRDFFDQAGDPTYADFSEFIDDPSRREMYHENGRIHEATYNSLVSRIADNYVFDRVFDTAAEPITDGSMIKRFVRSGRLSVVPTYHITNSRMEEVVVLALSSLIVDNKLSTGGRESIKRTPLILGMDEAHNFLADADTAQGRVIKSKFSDAAKQGRKERLGLFLITQDPGDIADPIFKQINTKVVLNIGDENALSSLNLPPELEDRVPYMEKGEMAVYSPDNSVPVEIVGLEKCVTRHG
ncbi:MAG: ATP-binding protein [Halobacteria archaeon]|nr:ATP-binding protein [Halobacteria archaeon]